MTVRSGYTQTEAGEIPFDWETHKLGELGKVIRGASPRPKGDTRFYGGSIPRLMVEDVTRDGKTVIPQIDFLTDEGAKRSRPCKKGTLTIVCSGTVGVPSFLGVDACIHDGFLALVHVAAGVSDDYLYHQLCRNQEKLDNSATHGGIFTNLTTFGVREFVICTPPTKAEQEAIAEALSDADALIDSLEQLIAKKRQIKQGAMQELLTGKKRLPGFSGKWEVTRLGSCLKFQVGFPFSSSFFNAEGVGIRLIKNRDLKNDDQLFYYSGDFNADYVVNNGDLLIGMDGDFIPCQWMKGPALLNQRVGRVVPTAKLDRAFAFYHLMKPLRTIEDSTSSTTVKHLSHGDIESIESPLPAISEQIAIANILSGMESEVSALEAKLNKSRQIKQGMMQELLTGRIRLI